MFQLKTSYCIHVKIEYITLKVTKEAVKAEKLSNEAILLSFSLKVTIVSNVTSF